MTCSHSSTRLDDGTVAIRCTPLASSLGSGGTVILTAEQHQRYLKWRSGFGLLQTLLPDLSASDRELLISGVNSDTWRSLFPVKEDRP